MHKIFLLALVSMAFHPNAQSTFGNDSTHVLAQFPGGMDALNKFVLDNVRYPETARKKGIQGQVIVRFVVAQTGEIEGVKVIKSISPELDSEAVRVVSMMPRWKPALQNGKPVKMMYQLPIRFDLKEIGKFEKVGIIVGGLVGGALGTWGMVKLYRWLR